MGRPCRRAAHENTGKPNLTRVYAPVVRWPGSVRARKAQPLADGTLPTSRRPANSDGGACKLYLRIARSFAPMWKPRFGRCKGRWLVANSRFAGHSRRIATGCCEPQRLILGELPDIW